MPRLTSVRIPKTGIAVFQAIATLDGERADNLVAHLSNDGVRTLPTLVETVRTAVGDAWDEELADAFVTHLLSLSTLAIGHDFSAEDLANHLASQVAEELGDTEMEVLPGRLASLLSVPSMRAFGKAVDVSQESDRLLHTSRVITDIRPVFGNDVEREPIGAVISHTLRLDYFEHGEVRTVSFALNTRDLAELKKTLDRAQAKGNTLSNLLDRVELTEFDLSQGESDD
ncbi:hypothetical protein ACAG24_009740 [Mycobacterium sp. pW049]|uniref:hypothetical protein n=1 Tax=[Mycobacterium] bulgaricum TaxID=3238985 RepID=UPI0035A8CF7F